MSSFKILGMKIQHYFKILRFDYEFGLQGVVASGLMVALMAWVARRRGALFIASFHPLLLIIVALAGSLMLDEKLHLGRFDTYSILP